MMKQRHHPSRRRGLQKAAFRVCLGMLLTLQTMITMAQTGFSPYFERSGKGSFDQYRNTLLCAAIMEHALVTEQNPARKEKLQQGIEYAIRFAIYILERGNVVEPGGVILDPGNLPADRTKAQNRWRDIADSLEQQDRSAKLEELWYLQQYGHKS